MKTGKIGEWAFILGVLLAVIAGLFVGIDVTIGAVLLGLGAIVGLLNIEKKETTAFLVAGIALLLSGSMVATSAVTQQMPYIGGYLAYILANIILFFAPVVLIIALKTCYMLAKKK